MIGTLEQKKKMTENGNKNLSKTICITFKQIYILSVKILDLILFIYEIMRLNMFRIIPNYSLPKTMV